MARGADDDRRPSRSERRDKSGGATSGVSSTRAAAAKAGRGGSTQKPFPLGFAAGVTVLVVGLGGLLGYAVLNTGSGFEDALTKADSQFSGIVVDANQTQNHTNPASGARVSYPDATTRAPDGGNHSPFWQTCGVYTEPLVPEHAVHSLEHGTVWITYQPELPADQIAALDDLVQGTDYRMISPYPGLSAPIQVSAWGRQITAQSASDPQVKKFVETYTDGPQTREKGAACTGLVDQPGTVPFVQDAVGGFVPGPADGPSVQSRGALAQGGEPGTEPSGIPDITATPAPQG